MEPRQARRVFALSAAVVAVTLALWFDPPPAPPDRIEVYAPPDDIDRIQIERGEQRVVLVRGPDGWRVGAGVDQPADDTEVRRLVEALAGLRYADPVAVPTGADPDDFGLGDVPWAVIEVEGPQGSQTIELGDPAEVGFRSYVRGPDGTILVARAGPHATVGQPASAFVDRRLFDATTVRSATLSGPDGAWSVVREGPGWLVADRWRGDPERVDAWLRVWGSVRLDPGAGAPPTDRSLSLARSDGDLRVDFAAGEPRSQLVLSDGREGSAAIEATLYALGPRQLAADTLVGLDRATADTVSLALGRVSWEGRRNGGAWTSPLGEGPSWDVVSAIAALPQVDPGTARRSPPRRPWGTITVTEGGRSWTVAVDRRRGDTHLAWWAGAGQPVAVPASAVDAVLAEVVPE